MVNTDTDADELSGSRYATHRKELLLLVQELRAMGAESDLDLPRVTVIGNQSAGKSSVVEAISGITVPRDAGTCTRCPMECRLSSSKKDWCCQISIRWEFEDDGSRKDETFEEKFGDLITNKADVEPALRKAQDTVLNPRGSGKLLPFSKNVVCVDLQGPDLTDLSFTDLPGIIQNADDDIVKLVENLVVSHIKGNCLILVALPMTDDIENQKALRLARREDPDGRRTIGVLTKPDMLGTGSTKAREMWLDVIEGRHHPLAHGYYGTRQPDDSERAGGISSHDARIAESNHFKSTLPWSSSLHPNRFGTNNLISTLSKLLVQVIKDALPGLRVETTTCLDDCNKELRRLPQPIQMEPVTYLLSLITLFHGAVDRFVQGGSVAQGLVQNNREVFTAFRDAIKRTTPNFQPHVDAQAAVAIPDSLESEENSLEGEDEDYSTDDKSTPFYLTDMRAHIEKSITRELPGHVPYESKVTLMAAFQRTWESSTNKCFNQIKEFMLKTLLDCIERTFSQYSNLKTLVIEALYELVEIHYKRCSDHVGAILEVELTPFTQNVHYLESCKDKWLARYKDIRARRPEEQGDDLSSIALRQDYLCSPSGFPATGQHSVGSALSILAKIGYPGLRAEDLGKLNPPDEYETELHVMAEVRGYFQVSYKRVIDNVPSLIDLKFTKAIPKDIQSFLISKLGLGAADAAKRCANYLAEDPTMVARREELMARKSRLESVKSKLQNFGI